MIDGVGIFHNSSQVAITIFVRAESPEFTNFDIALLIFAKFFCQIVPAAELDGVADVVGYKITSQCKEFVEGDGRLDLDWTHISNRI